MTLNEYIQQLVAYRDKNPELGDKLVVHSSDPEGNRFHEVVYEPSAGEFDQGEFTQDGAVNAVCIN